MQFLVPWAVYVEPVRGRRVVDWFVESRGWSLSLGEIEWLEAQRRSWLSVWEVLDVDRGRGFHLRDLLSLEERFIHEVKGSQNAHPRLGMLCRVVDAGQISVIAGVHPQPLPPRETADVVGRFRHTIKKKGVVPIDLLRQSDIASLLAHSWDAVVQKIQGRSMPELRNTDDDELLLSTERYDFDPARKADVEAALTRIANIERDEEPGRFRLMRPGKRRRDPATVLGAIVVTEGELRIEANSVRRADSLCVLIENAFGELLTTGLRSYTDPRAMIGQGEVTARAPTTEAESEVIRRVKRAHYEQWQKDRIPALDGKTPRQAARSKQGREQLETLLKEMEYHESRLPEAERFDVSILRAQLGL
jgi:hypothetical protein